MKLPVFWSVLLCSVMFCGCTENCAPVVHIYIIYHISSLARSWPVQMQALLQECLNSCCQHTGNSLDVDGVSLNLRPVLRWMLFFRFCWCNLFFHVTLTHATLWRLLHRARASEWLGCWTNKIVACGSFQIKWGCELLKLKKALCLV